MNDLPRVRNEDRKWQFFDIMFNTFRGNSINERVNTKMPMFIGFRCFRNDQIGVLKITSPF